LNLDLPIGITGVAVTASRVVHLIFFDDGQIVKEKLRFKAQMY
jgi:hypothetical protein